MQILRTLSIVFSLVTAAVVATPGIVGSYNFNGSVWRVPPVVYCVNPANGPVDAAGAPLIADDEFVADVRAAFQTWEDLPSSSIRFRFNGVCASDPDADWDTISAVGWGKRSDKNELGVTYRKTSPTMYLRGGASKEIFEADIVINNNAGLISRSFDAYEKTYLRAVLTHEAGHFIGLAHSDDDGALMYDVLRTSTGVHTTLTRDDIDGVSLLYP